MSAPTVIIVGAGQAGASTAAALREMGFTGRVLLIGDEAHLPYHRPPLSKGHLTSAGARDNLWLHPSTFYQQHGIELRLSERVTRIDRANHGVELAGGEFVDYDHLVLALGARNRTLALEGAELDGVLGLRSLAEADEIRDRLAAARRLVVVGGGFIGLEVAATATRLGIDTVLIEVADRLMSRVLSPEMSAHLLTAHRSRGLRIELGSGVAELTGFEGLVRGVTTSAGQEFPADLVLVGVGAVPHTGLAQDAGLSVDNGIVVDEYLATEDPQISAVGDCVSCPNRFAGGQRVRLESVHNATAQPRFLASRIVGQPAPYDSVPWFWSDQADMKLQIAGLGGPGSDAVVRGDPAGGRFSVFNFRDGELCSVESLNRPGDHMAARKLLAVDSSLTPAQAGDIEFDLRAHVAALGSGVAVSSTAGPRTGL